jgi:hypothetical protein
MLTVNCAKIRRFFYELKSLCYACAAKAAVGEPLGDLEYDLRLFWYSLSQELNAEESRVFFKNWSKDGRSL